MAAIATLPVLFATGIHSARPAASAVGKGGLYACSTHSLIYQTDGSSWTTWATLTGTGLTDPMTTRGDVIVRNASNVTARLGRGSAGTVFTSDGTDVSWQAPSGGAGALVLIEQHSASSSATLDFTAFISSTYDDYLFELLNIVPATNGTTLLMRMGTGGGPTYDAGSNYYSGGSNLTGCGIGITITNAAGYGQLAASLRLMNPQSATMHKYVIGPAAWHDGANVQASSRGWLWADATAVTAVRFLMASGNIASGIIRVYGITK